jgi:hypothetical protein
VSDNCRLLTPRSLYWMTTRDSDYGGRRSSGRWIGKEMKLIIEGTFLWKSELSYDISQVSRGTAMLRCVIGFTFAARGGSIIRRCFHALFPIWQEEQDFLLV